MVRGKEVDPRRRAGSRSCKAPVDTAAGRPRATLGRCSAATPSRGRDLRRQRLARRTPLFAVPLAKPQWHRMPAQQRARQHSSRLAGNRRARRDDAGRHPRRRPRRAVSSRTASASTPSASTAAAAAARLAQTYPGDRDGQYVLPNTGAAAHLQQTLTLTDRASSPSWASPTAALCDVGMAAAGRTAARLPRPRDRQGELGRRARSTAQDIPKDEPKASAAADHRARRWWSATACSSPAGRRSRRSSRTAGCCASTWTPAGSAGRSYVASSGTAGAMCGVQTPGIERQRHAPRLRQRPGLRDDQPRRRWPRSTRTAARSLAEHLPARPAAGRWTRSMGFNRRGPCSGGSTAGSSRGCTTRSSCSQGKLFMLPTDGQVPDGLRRRHRHRGQAHPPEPPRRRRHAAWRVDRRPARRHRGEPGRLPQLADVRRGERSTTTCSSGESAVPEACPTRSAARVRHDRLGLRPRRRPALPLRHESRAGRSRPTPTTAARGRRAARGRATSW